MQVRTPHTTPRDDGKFTVTGNGGNGDPWAMINLDEREELGVLLESPEECDQIIKAAREAKDEIIRRRELRDAPHTHRATAADRPCLDCGGARGAAIHAPVITDSERDCDERNPDGSGEPCHRGGDHGVHRDSNGDEWRTDLQAADL